MAVEKKLYTFDEFEAVAALPENRDRNFELINGEIVEKVPTQKHGIIALRIGSRILVFIEQRGLGYVAVEVRHRMPGDNHNARQPDVSYYADTTIPVVDKGAVPRMPDLAVEVKSPDDSYKEMREKAEYYLRNGAQMVWLVYPEKRFIESYTADGDLQILTDGDSLNGGKILPGFSLAVSDVFKL